jgi:hypothetical protein
MYGNSSVAQNWYAWKTIRRFHVNSVEALESFWGMRRRSESRFAFLNSVGHTQASAAVACRPIFFNGRTEPNFAAQHRDLQSKDCVNDQRCALALEVGFLAIRCDRGANACSIDIS